jgi:hypothetical protein
MFPISSLFHFVRGLKKVSDPRSKQGQFHPFRTILAIVLLGLIAIEDGKQIKDADGNEDVSGVVAWSSEVAGIIFAFLFSELEFDRAVMEVFQGAGSEQSIF